ncbi:MAG: hypothetical protein KH704_10515 [Clostridiales bacterium]|nr:hypothetical protein [Clostridiales bacterium]
MTPTAERGNREHMASPLEVLDELDEFRRGHQNERLYPSDWCMRCMEAIVARACGFEGRNNWTGALAAAPSTRYHRDLQDPMARIRF